MARLSEGRLPLGPDEVEIVRVLGNDLRRQIDDVAAVVAVLRGRLPHSRIGDGRPEVVHLHATVVDIELTGDLSPGGLQDPSDGVADGGPTGVTEVERTGRVGGDELDVEATSLQPVRGSVVSGCLYDATRHVALGGGGDFEVEKTRSGNVCALDAGNSLELCGDGFGQLPRRDPRLLGQLHGDVGGIVPVGAIAGPLDGHRRDLVAREHAGSHQGLQRAFDRRGNGFRCHPSSVKVVRPSIIQPPTTQRGRIFESTMILITAATGTFGSRIVEHLTTAGVPCRALVRHPHTTTESELVDWVAGDMDRPASLAAALDGVDRVFLNAPMDDRKGDRLCNFITAAAATSRPQIVLLTGGVRHDDALGEQGRRAEQALADSGLDWVKVGPQTVMETNFLPVAALIGAGSFPGCVDGGRIGMVALDDVVEAFTTVLRSDDAGLLGREFIITGPKAITFSDVAAAAADVLGHPVTYEDMPPSDYRAALIQYAGFTADNVDYQVMFHMLAMREGQAELVTADFTTLTGRASRTIRDFFADNRTAFAPTAAQPGA